MREFRYVEVKDKKTGEIVRKEFFEVKAGDIFRIFEPSGQPVDIQWHTASKDAYLNTDGIAVVSYDPEFDGEDDFEPELDI